MKKTLYHISLAIHKDNTALALIDCVKVMKDVVFQELGLAMPRTGDNVRMGKLRLRVFARIIGIGAFEGGKCLFALLEKPGSEPTKGLPDKITGDIISA